MTKNLWATQAASLALVIALAPAPGLAADASQADQVQAERIQVGQVAPDFTLPDPDGANHALSTLRGEKNLLMVFFRGAW